MKTLLLILLGLVSLPGLSQDWAAGLVACYSFKGNANDESGNSNNGVVNGAVSATDRFANGNSAYQFNGVGEYIAIPAEKLKNPAYAFSCWAKPAALPAVSASSVLLSIGDPGADQGIMLYNDEAGGNTGWGILSYDTGGTPVPGNSTSSLPALNVWYHILQTRSTDSIRLYVNGVLVASYPVTGKSPQYGANVPGATIGCRSNLTQFFSGALDDIRVYNRALSAAEVQALYLAPNLESATLRSDYQTPCSGTPVVYSVAPTIPGARYQWEVNGVKVGDPTPSGTFTYPSPAGATGYQTTVSVEIASGASCVRKRLEQTLYFSPPAPILAQLTASTLIPCAGAPVTLRVSPGIAEARYQWRIDGTLQPTESPVLVYTFPGLADRYETVVNVDVIPPDIPCAGKTSRELRLDIYPALSVSCPAADLAIAGETARYDVQVTGGQPPYRYSWVIGNGALPAGDQRTASWAFDQAGTYPVLLQVTDSRACQAQCELEQVVLEPLVFPNVFTPNGDGKNETFTVQYPGSDFEMTIYNRWGKLVAVIHDGMAGWDGQSTAPGTYFYQIRIGRRQYKGLVTLLR
jgi:gliding motility-associated-like protein